jgi:hypothetical protein
MKIRPRKKQPGRCPKCHERAGWGRSPLCYPCLGAAQLLVTAAGAVVDPNTPTRELIYAARYRYRAVRCGKDDCRRCPHDWYAYRVWNAAGRQHEQYLGPTDEQGDPYEPPLTRRPLVSSGRRY